LAKKHPNISFVAVTAPLTTVQTGPKAWVKQLMGKHPSGYLDNIKRTEFNTMLRERYGSTGRLFDLARAEAESTGEHCRTDASRQAAEALCPELTNDGGHLNERGQEIVASAFLNFASSLSAK
jgi:hypothetical protein